MANKDIFVHFLFFLFSQVIEKTQKWNILVGIFCSLIFPLLIKNEKTEDWHLVYWIFYFSIFR